MTNDSCDRHVLSAAVRTHAHLTASSSRASFPGGVYDLDAGLSATKPREQAKAAGVPLPRILDNLAKNFPHFVRYFCEEQQLDVSGEERGTQQ